MGQKHESPIFRRIFPVGLYESCGTGHARCDLRGAPRSATIGGAMRRHVRATRPSPARVQFPARTLGVECWRVGTLPFHGRRTTMITEGEL
jgi:hypothetical protein